MVEIRLKEILKERNMSLLELSEMTNISSTTLSQFQNKKTESVHYNTLSKIASALNVPIGDIIINKKNPYKVLVVLDKDQTKKLSIDFKVQVYENNHEYHSDGLLSYCLTELNNGSKLLLVNIDSMNLNDLPKSMKITEEHVNNIENTFLFFNALSYLIVHNILFINEFMNLEEQDQIIVSFSKILKMLKISDKDKNKDAYLLNCGNFNVNLIERSEQDLNNLRANYSNSTPKSIADFSYLTTLNIVETMYNDANFEEVLITINI